MLLLVLAIAVLFGGVALLVLTLAMARRRRKETEQRLALVVRGPLQKQSASQASSKADRTGTKIAALLMLSKEHPWALETSPGELAVWAAVAAALTFALMKAVLGFPAAFAASSAAAAFILAPRLALIREKKRIEKAFAAMFPDTVDTVARMLRAGLPVTSAFATAGQEAPSPVNGVFASMSGHMSIGMPLAEALRLASRQITLPDFRFFAVAVLLQQSAGGNLVSTLEMLALIMRKRRAVQLKARAVTAEVRFSAYVLGALPFVTSAALLVISPGYLTPLFTDPRGHVILSFAAGGLILSFVTMRAMMKSVEAL